MKFYHGTTEKNWKEIQKEGVLWGRKDQYWMGNKMSRITYFAKNKEDAGIFDDRGITKEKCVILEVDFPEFKEYHHWEFVTYDPIKIDRVKRIS